MLTKLSNNTLVQSFTFPSQVPLEKKGAGLEEDQKIAVAARLNGFLADSYLLMLKTHAYHWNVKGKKALDFQDISEENYTFLFDNVDRIADRIGDLGYEVMGTFREFVDSSLITEAKKGLSSTKMCEDLLQSHQDILLVLLEMMDYTHEIGDDMTRDLLIDAHIAHERATWALSQYLGRA